MVHQALQTHPAAKIQGRYADGASTIVFLILKVRWVNPVHPVVPGAVDVA